MKKSMEDLSIKEAKQKLQELTELSQLLNQPVQEKNSSSWEIGKNIYIATVTHHYVGKLISIGEKELVITNACWVADDGRFHKFMEGKIDDNVEFEPFPKNLNVMVGRGSVIVACKWDYPLPNKAK